MFSPFKSDWLTFNLGAVRLCRCEHSNCTRVRTKSTAIRPSDGGGLGMVLNELQTDSFMVTNHQVYVTSLS